VKDIPRTFGESCLINLLLPGALGFLLLFLSYRCLGKCCGFIQVWMDAIQYCDYAFDNHKNFIPSNAANLTI